MRPWVRIPVAQQKIHSKFSLLSLVNKIITHRNSAEQKSNLGLPHDSQQFNPVKNNLFVRMQRYTGNSSIVQGLRH